MNIIIDMARCIINKPITATIGHCTIVLNVLTIKNHIADVLLLTFVFLVACVMRIVFPIIVLIQCVLSLCVSMFMNVCTMLV